MSGFPKTVRDIITTRAGGRCEICGADAPEQLHHRRARGMGSTKRPDTNTASNGLAVSNKCHTMLESRREKALDMGWLVHQNQSPADVPVFRRGHWVMLLDTGQVFIPPSGHGRCVRCGGHIGIQGHRDGCQDHPGAPA